MKVVFYNVSLLAGGIEKALENLIELISKEHEIEIVYTDESKLDPIIVKRLSKNSYVHKLTEPIDCDIAIWCRIYFDYKYIKNTIKAKKYISWIHSKPRELNDCLLDNPDFINDTDMFICVSEAIKEELNIPKPSIVIYNPVSPNINDLAAEFRIERSPNILNLVTVSRLSNGKGFERLFKLISEIEEKNIQYKLQIVGNGRAKEKEIKDMFSKLKNVEFIGYKENPYPYIKNADYLIQLSDYECFCTSVTEAQVLGTPCITTNFPSSFEQTTNDFNGLILPLSDITYTKYLDDIINNKHFYKENLKNFKPINNIYKWKKLVLI